MAGGGGAGLRSLEYTPTWAVAIVCTVIIVISFALEKVLHKIGQLFVHRKKMALYEALEKVKAELMILGFISLLLTFGQKMITNICIPPKLANTMLFCPLPGEGDHHGAHHRRLLLHDHRFLGGGGGSVYCKKQPGKVPLITVDALHQLHIFIFFLAVFHVLYSAFTMILGRLKTRGWKDWEREATSATAAGGPSRFRLTHETSFVRAHTSNVWTRNKFSFYVVCFCRQFFRSVRKHDYQTMRHGFVTVHLAPGSKFDFQKYIKRSLEDDFKVVVGISPVLWASAIFFLLMDVNGWHAMIVLSFVPIMITLAVGTKLQAIIGTMAIEIVEKHAVIQGMPLVQVSDSHFWFSYPPLLLHLIHYVLFQNAFEITYFFWIWYEFGINSCFHSQINMVILRVILGFFTQFLCSYITLPLYALVTQMGSTMKRSIFDEQTSKALMQWHKNALKKTGDGKFERARTRTLGESPGDSPTHDHRGNGNINLSNQQEASNPDQTVNVTASVDPNGGHRDLLS